MLEQLDIQRQKKNLGIDIIPYTKMVTLPKEKADSLPRVEGLKRERGILGQSLVLVSPNNEAITFSL